MRALASVSTSSLIGVAMSCAGNVLISLALTVQKLAHRRQEEELSRSNSELDNEPNDSPSSSNESEPSPLTRRGSRGGRAIVLVPSPPDEAQEDSLGVIRIQSPTPSPSRSRSQSQLDTNGNGDSAEEQENGSKETQVKEGAYLRSKLWWFGLLLIATGEGGNFLSYGFAPASVVAPLGTVALIANCLFAPLILRERFHLKELVGMGLAILGAITVVFSSSQSNPRLDPDQLVTAISQIPFIVYTVLVTVAVAGLMAASETSYGEKWIGIDVGICALFGGFTVLSTKALSSLLSTIFLNLFKRPIGWILLVVLVGTSILQVKYLNRALMRFESKEVIPTQFVFFSLSAIIGSAVLFQEFRDVTFPQFVNFAFGIATTFLGVHLLTSYSESPSEKDEREEDDEDDQQTPRQTPIINLGPEQQPLLVPIPADARQQNQLLRRISGTPTTAQIPPQIRVMRKPSNADLTSTLGINTQAGFLLMATTPPAGSSYSSRGRAPSRDPRNGRDEERGQIGRGMSYGSTRRGS